MILSTLMLLTILIVLSRVCLYVRYGGLSKLLLSKGEGALAMLISKTLFSLNLTPKCSLVVLCSKYQN